MPDVTPGAEHSSQTIGQSWRATLRARRVDRVYLGLTGAAFALGLVDSVTAKTLATVPMMCLLHAAGTATGLAGRRARGSIDASPRYWQPQVLLGRLLGALTLSVAFSTVLLVAAWLVVDAADSLTGSGITALSGVVWITAVVFVFSTVLPRRLDAVAAVLLFPAAAALYKARTQFTNTTATRAVDFLWENFGALVFSDAAPGTAAWADMARWASNIALAIVCGMLIAHARRGTDRDAPRSRRWLGMLAMAGCIALGARLLVPRVADQVAWIDVGSSSARIEAAGRPVLYNFTADWCAICNRLERDLFAEPGDARWINESFVPVRVLDRKREDGHNSQEVQQLRDRFEVTGFPTLVVLAPDGTVRARLAGYSGNLTEVREVLGSTLTGATAR